MAESASPHAASPGTSSGADGSDEQSTRGRLTVQDQVIERLAAHASVGVPGVVRHRDALDKAVGRSLPRASAQISGRIAALDLELAVAWQTRLDHVAAQVRQRVRDEVQRLGGVDVTRVNVTVKRIVRERARERVQ